MSDPVQVKDRVVAEFTALMVEEGRPVPTLSDDDVLTEHGLDSLGLAVLATRLEDAFGYDPFSDVEQAVYPRTLADFVGVYAAHEPRG